MNTLPNIVLIHGAWANGSAWSAVIQLRPLNPVRQVG